MTLFLAEANTTAINYTGMKRAGGGEFQMLCPHYSVISLRCFKSSYWKREKKGRWEGAQVRGTRAVGTRRVPGLSCSRQPRAGG